MAFDASPPMTTIWRQIYAMKSNQPTFLAYSETIKIAIRSNGGSLSVEEEQKCEQIQPQRPHEMPVNAQGFEPYYIPAVDDSHSYPNAVHH